MANRFLLASIDAIKRNGALCTYTKVQTGTYNVETGSTVNTSTDYQVYSYKKHIKSSQYSYPNLIGKDSGIFYIANDNLLFVPSPKDKIFWEGNTYTVDSYEAHMAHNQVVLYTVVAIRN
jgi:hypothetical protein